MPVRGPSREAAATRAAEATLYRTEDRLRGILAAADAAFVSVDAEGLVLEWNPTAEAMFGWSRQEALGRMLVEMIAPEPVAGGSRDLERLLRVNGSAPAGRRQEVNVRDRDRHIFPAELTVSCLPAGDTHIWHAFVRDLAPQRRAEQEVRRVERELSHQAEHDTLTGLPNRALLIERLERALGGGETTVGALLVGVDDLRVVNESLGHSAGDALLVGVASRLRSVCAGDSGSGALARLGGDEFAVVCDRASGIDEVVGVAERIAAALSAPIEIAGELVFTSVSTGIALSEPESTPESLLSDADTAMHEAKERGRGRYQVFDASMRGRMVDRLRQERELRLALERGELRLHYQPIVSVSDGGLVGAEALIRWQHPTRGLLMPGAFLPLAEQTGLILPIGRWVLQEAFAQAARWHEAQPREQRVRISVNLSGHQLADGDAVPLITELLDETGLEPSRLALEITETVLMTELETPIESLRKLQALGVRIVLDDFGTGYSSLSYLRRLPLDAVKLDRSFVSRLDESLTDRQIVAAVVQLARALRMTVVAEGVETAEQLAALRQLGCHLAQGYHLARPMPPGDLATTLGLQPGS
jgi:diguanylate cyclase (GGDEF)-like protein/PAS domain S-box-containing protein